MAMWKNRCGRGATTKGTGKCRNLSFTPSSRRPKSPSRRCAGCRRSSGFCRTSWGTMAENPVLLNGFAATFGSFHGGSFDECEKQLLLLTNAVTLKCPWTIAAHSTFAIEDGVAVGDVKAIRDGELPENRKYRALSQFTKTLMESKGNATEADIEKFTSAGYSKAQVLEVVLCIGISATTATTTNVAATPIEDRFKAQIWAAA